CITSKLDNRLVMYTRRFGASNAVTENRRGKPGELRNRVRFRKGKKKAARFPVAPVRAAKKFSRAAFTDIAARRLRFRVVPGTHGHAARELLRGLTMQNDSTIDRTDRVDRMDRTDLCRMDDDGCPHGSDPTPHDDTGT